MLKKKIPLYLTTKLYASAVRDTTGSLLSFYSLTLMLLIRTLRSFYLSICGLLVHKSVPLMNCAVTPKATFRKNNGDT